MISWLESIPQDKLVARSYLNRERDPARETPRQWIPEAYEDNVPLSERWRKRYVDVDKRDMALDSLLGDLDRMEHEVAVAIQEAKEKQPRPLIFAKTRVLTDDLPDGPAWLESQLGKEVLEGLHDASRAQTAQLELRERQRQRDGATSPTQAAPID